MFALDHVVFTTRTIDTLCGVWSRLGFNVSQRGFHPFGTMNNLMIFQSTFLELIAFDDPAALESAKENGTIPADLATTLKRALETRDGPSLLAVTSDEAERDLQLASTRGVAVRSPLHFKRAVTLPTGEVSAADVTVNFMADPAATPVPIFCSVQNRSEAIWVSEWQDHPNTAHEITAVTYASEEPDSVLPYLDAVLGVPRTAETSISGHVYRLPGGKVEVVTYESLDDRFGTPGNRSGGSGHPLLEAVTVSVRSMHSLEKILVSAGLEHRRTRQGSIQVDSDETGGVRLEFTPLEGQPA